MKYFLLIVSPLLMVAQSGSDPAAVPDVVQQATRMVQLMESTAVAVPGLVTASAPVKQNADATLVTLQRNPRNPAVAYQFMNVVKAYLAVSESLPRPVPFPAVGDQQYAELRDGLQKMRRYFEGLLQEQNQSAQTRNADPNDLKRYAEADAKMLPAAKGGRVVFMGDSITDFWRLNEYFTGKDFVNRGISGQTTGQMLARYRQDVLGLNPRAVVILAGINDIGRGVALSQIEDNLAMMGDLAKARGIKVGMASVLPVSDYHKAIDPNFEVTKQRPPATIKALNQWIEALCRTEGYVYVDYYTAMVDASGQLPVDQSDDGLHPNGKGYRVMSPVALAAVTKLTTGPDEAEAQTKRRFRLSGK